MAEETTQASGNESSDWQTQTCQHCGFVIDNPDDNEDCPICGEPLDQLPA